jgi:hypothetical protein
MKNTKLIVAAIIIITLAGCAMVDYRTLQPDQQNVVKVESVSMSQSSLFLAIQQWFAESLGKSKEALQIQDKENGIILGKIIVPNGIKDPLGIAHDVQMTIKVEIKDNKYRISFSDFQFYYQGAGRHVSAGAEHDSAKKTAEDLSAKILTYVNVSKSNKDF